MGEGTGACVMQPVTGGDPVFLVGVEGLRGARWGHRRSVPLFSERATQRLLEKARLWSRVA